MARRVYLHIGTMKSATSYLQALFDVNKEHLAAHGITWHSARLNQRGFQEFLGSAMLAPEGAGSWGKLIRDVRRTPGDVLLSMELLARLPEPRVRRIAEALRAEELHVLVTARDLTRAAPSHWQETTQNRGTTAWSDWIEAVCASDPLSDAEDRPPFWAHHYLPTIIDTWSKVAPVERIHVLTVPRSGSDPELIWKRFATVIGVPGEGVEQPSFSNAALGATSAELMRRVNVHLGGVKFDKYRAGFKSILGKNVLSQRAGREPRPGLTEDQYHRLRAVATDIVAGVERSGVRVVGDLGDLMAPEDAKVTAFDPGQISDAELLEAAIEGLAGLGLAYSKLHNKHVRLVNNLPEEAEQPSHGLATRGRGAARRARSVVRRLRSKD